MRGKSNIKITRCISLKSNFLKKMKEHNCIIIGTHKNEFFFKCKSQMLLVYFTINITKCYANKKLTTIWTLTKLPKCLFGPIYRMARKTNNFSSIIREDLNSSHSFLLIPRTREAWLPIWLGSLGWVHPGQVVSLWQDVRFLGSPNLHITATSM